MVVYRTQAIVSHSITILIGETVVLLPTYKGLRIVRNRIGRVSPEIKLGWLMAAIMLSTEENPEIKSVERTNKLK